MLPTARPRPLDGRRSEDAKVAAQPVRRPHGFQTSWPKMGFS